MEDYIFIQQWMIELFKPKEKKKGAGVDYVKLMIFAYIYSFSRDGKSKWYGKQQTLANMVGCGESTICNKLKELVDDGLIIKEEVKLYGMFHHNNYYVNSEITPIVSERTPIISEETPMVSEETNNKSIYKSNNKSINNSRVDVKNPTYTLSKKRNINIYEPRSEEPLKERSDMVF